MKESSKALAAYVLYRDMGPSRSLEGLCRGYPDRAPSVRLLKRWSAAHGWQQRCRLHDRAIADQAAAEDAAQRVAQLRALREERLQIARVVLRAKGVHALLRLAASGEITASAAVQMIALADATERKELGEPDSRLEVSGPGGPISVRDDIDLSGMTLEELRAYRDALRAERRRDAGD